MKLTIQRIRLVLLLALMGAFGFGVGLLRHPIRKGSAVGDPVERPQLSLLSSSSPKQGERVPAKDIEDALGRGTDSERLWCLTELLGRVELGEIGEVVDALTALEDATFQAIALRAALARWVELDGAGCLRYLVENQGAWTAQLTQTFTQSLFALWAKSDLERSRAAVEALSGDVKRDALLAIADTMSASAPKESLMLGLEAELTEASLEQAGKLWDLLAASEGLTAAELRGTLNASGLTDGVIGRIFTSIANQKVDEDPAGAVQWAAAFEGPAMKAFALEPVFARISKASPDQAVTLLETLPNWQGHLSIVRQVAREVLKKDPRKASEWVNSSQAGIHRFLLLRDLASDGIQKDPRHVAKVAEWAAYTSDVRYMHFAPVAGRFAEVDPEGALAWFQNLEPGGQVDFAAAGAAIGSRWAEEGIDQALAKIEEFPTSPKLNGFTTGVAEVLGRDAPEKGWQWVATLPEDLAPAALEGLVRGQVQSDPEAAAAQVDQIESRALQVKAIEALTEAWAQDDPESAAIWLLGQDGAEDTKRATETLLTEWSYVDPLAASAWLRELPAGAARDGAVVAMTKRVKAADPQLSLEWAVSISDAKTREALVPRLAYHWYRLNPTEALDGAMGMGLTEIELQKMMDFIEKGSW